MLSLIAVLVQDVRAVPDPVYFPDPVIVDEGEFNDNEFNPVEID